MSKKLSAETRQTLRSRTRLVHLGRDSEVSQGFVNVPAFRGSTVLFPDAAALGKAGRQHSWTPGDRFPNGADRPHYTYGTHGTPSTEALNDAWSDISGAVGTILVPSGLAAIAMALQAALKAGDHLLMADTVYFPARRYAEKVLRPNGVETTYFDPALGAGVAELIRPNTKAIFAESPGSETMEVMDIPAVAAAAHARGLCVIMDNTWATPLLFPAHAHGVDLVIEAGTKYLSGHADLLLGLVSANAEWWPRLHANTDLHGIPPSPEDVFLALRGLRTMELRLREAERQALALATWMKGRPEVQRVLHPALPGHPGHEFWKRDFNGSSGLFSIVLQPASDAAVAALLDSLELFGLGYSWAGYESLVVPFDSRPRRTVTNWSPGGPTLRISVGLEDLEDLKADLDRGFERFRAAI